MIECPRCKSNAVTNINGNLLCLHCGNQEALEDYPISYREHRAYCREYGRPDPGPCEPAERNLEELHDRLLTEKPSVLRDTPRGKPTPKLHGGVSL